MAVSANNADSERRRHPSLMDNMRRNRHTQSADNKGNLNRPRTENSHRNRRPITAFAEGMNRAQFTKSSLDSGDIEKPTIALLGLLCKAVSTSFAQHQLHGVISPNPDPTFGR